MDRYLLKYQVPNSYRQVSTVPDTHPLPPADRKSITGKCNNRRCYGRPFIPFPYIDISNISKPDVATANQGEMDPDVVNYFCFAPLKSQYSLAIFPLNILVLVILLLASTDGVP